MTDTPLLLRRKSCKTDQKSVVQLNPLQQHSKLNIGGRKVAKNRQGGENSRTTPGDSG